MFFSRAPCFFRKRKASTSEAALEIGEPMSQNFNYKEYGDGGIPPWMNSYASYTTIEVTPAAPSKRYHTKHAYDPLTSYPTCPSEESDKNKSLPPSPPLNHCSDKGRFFRNRGLDRQRNLKPEYEEIGGADWGEPDEYTSARGRRIW